MDGKELHEKILYPVVRVRTSKAGGSGTVIYSEPDPDNDGDYQTFVLTNWHVVEAAITTKKEWDPLLGIDVKKDVFAQVSVEVFDYVRLSERDSANTYRADVVAYDKNQDLAILKLDSPRRAPYVATLIDREKVGDIKLFTAVWACGCSLGHDPFATTGHITFLKEDIDNRIYWMNSADQIFGNSGGAVFSAATGEQIGVTSRVTVTQMGFSLSVQTWMSFCIPAWRIYEFLEEQELAFLYDPADTYAAAMERRKQKQEDARKSLLRSGNIEE